MQSRLHRLSQKIRRIFKNIDSKTSAVALSTGIRCKKACGECCLNKNVEAMAVELIPLALKLRKLKKLELYYALSKKLEHDSCFFYSPNSLDPRLGSCSVYSERPSLCRLFGFSAARNKYGEASLASCHLHKKLQPDEYKNAAYRLEEAKVEMPFLGEFHHQLEGCSNTPGLNERQPINRAFSVAAEYVLHYREPSNFPEVPVFEEEVCELEA